MNTFNGSYTEFTYNIDSGIKELPKLVEGDIIQVYRSYSKTDFSHFHSCFCKNSLYIYLVHLSVNHIKVKCYICHNVDGYVFHPTYVLRYRKVHGILI